MTISDKSSFGKSLLVLFGFIILCLLVGGIGSWFTEQGVHSWYPHILKPTWTPPNWVFAPVWTVLYFLMAISIWLIWKEPSKAPKETAYFLFGFQLLANLLWSALFFTFRCPLCALFDIVILWLLIAATINSFHHIKPIAAYLLVPYLLWTSYAVALNASIWLHN